MDRASLEQRLGAEFLDGTRALLTGCLVLLALKSASSVTAAFDAYP